MTCARTYSGSVFSVYDKMLIFLSLYGPRLCTQCRAEDLHLSAIVREGDMSYKFKKKCRYFVKNEEFNSLRISEWHVSLFRDINMAAVTWRRDFLIPVSLSTLKVQIFFYFFFAADSAWFSWFFHHGTSSLFLAIWRPPNPAEISDGGMKDLCPKFMHLLHVSDWRSWASFSDVLQETDGYLSNGSLKCSLREERADLGCYQSGNKCKIMIS